MKCTEAHDDLAELACGALAGARKQQLEQHLAGCAGCRRELGELREVSRLLRATPAPEVRLDVETLYREAARREQQRLRRWRRLAVAACAVAALLLLFFTLKLEVCLERNQLVLHWGWGQPPEEVPVVMPAPRPREDQRVADHERRLRVLNELVMQLAGDVQTLDLRQQTELAELRARVERLRQESALQWAAAQRDVADLYTERFLHAKKEER
jgi:hypothetical protein